MKTTTFRGQEYRAARNLFCLATKGPLVTAGLYVGPDTETWSQLRAMMIVTTSPSYSGARLMEDTYGPWTEDMPPESFEAAALLLAASHGYTCGDMTHRESAWGQPIIVEETTA